MEPTTEQKGRGTMNGKPVFEVAAKTIINTKSGFAKKLLCDGMTFSTGDACVYECAFCYVPSMFQKLERVAELKHAHGLSHGEMVVRRGNALAILESELVHKSGKPKYPDANDRRVIYASPSVDVAGNIDLAWETAEACKLILRHTAWHIRLLSKSNLLHRVGAMLLNDGFSARAKERMIFGVSTGTLDDQLAKVFERKTPLVSARLKSLHWLQDAGFRTFGMLCPSLPQRNGEEYVKFSKSAMAAIRAERCEHVWAEVINVRGDSMVATVKALYDGGFREQASLLAEVQNSSLAWHTYNHYTFHAHVSAMQEIGINHREKLRYLTYTTSETQSYWEACRSNGAVLL